MNTAVEHRAPVLVDANVIIESYRTGTWGAVAGGYRVETVEDCVIETQTGFQRRREEELIEVRELRASLEAEHAVDDRERAELAVQIQGIWLDRGKNRSGPTRSDGMTRGCCADRTRPVCDVESGLVFGID